MAFASDGVLSSAVTGAGGFGFFGAGFLSTNDIRANISTARKKLDIKDGEPVPIGIGFIGWILEITEQSDDPRLLNTLAEKPAAIWFAFGTNLGKYIAQVHEYDSKRDHKTIVFVMVNSVEDALKAANEWKADVLVVQGIEAGGHGGSEAPPLLTLLQAAIDATPSGPLIIAAGGISTGAQIAALLTMGASGVVLGTRFLFTEESIYTSAQKKALVEADLIGSTVRTLAFDEVGRTNGWPPKHDGRALVNDIIKDVEVGLDLETRLKKFDESASVGDTSRLIVWAGTGVGLTKNISSAANVVHQLETGTVEALQSQRSLIVI
ncbi:NPD-domain-containing protein [Dendrothele bispora CBS 962.96]|uniref:NPD-domain-containing protein n=1 Tax=Dendrothele bispora (strain CBS 962.96) TaxID=1314807 RepID=A0A4S8M8P8_DENBC|nr:NPD-domain-containing protein [Dendrothele bispora CBS 962.96]